MIIQAGNFLLNGIWALCNESKNLCVLKTIFINHKNEKGKKFVTERFGGHEVYNMCINLQRLEKDRFNFF